MYRQGDILFIRTEKISPIDGLHSKQVRTGDRLIVAEGELTGHAHAIPSPSADIFRILGSRYLRALDDVEVVHEEHKAITLPKGTYEIRQQREFEHGPVAVRD